MAMFPKTLTPKPPQFLHCSSPFISTYWVNIETSCLVYRLTVASPSLWTTKLPWKRRGYVTWPVLNFGRRIHISGMAEAKAVKFCTKGWHITHKMGVVLLTWPLFVCATVDLEKNSPRHSVNWEQQCRQWRTTAYRTYGARGHIRLRPKLHQLDLLQTWLYNILASGVWALSFKCVVITDISWVCVAICYWPMLVAW